MSVRIVTWCLALGAGCALGLGPVAGFSVELPGALAPADVDWARCRAWGDGKDLGVIPSNAVAVALGFEPSGPGGPWETPRLGGEFRHFGIVFTQPIAMGTLVTDYADGDHRVAILNAGAAGDLAEDAQWQTLSGGAVTTFPTGTWVRAFRFTHQISALPWDIGLRPSRLPHLLPLRERYWNPAQLGVAEWSADASTAGHPERWLAYWPRVVEVAAVVCLPREPTAARSLALPAAVSAHPAAVPVDQWQTFVVGTATRAVQVTVPGRPIVATLVKLEADAAPPRAFGEPSPFRIAGTMPLEGILAMRIADHEGRTVRRLVAEVPRPAGGLHEPWDLKNDAGAYVGPGVYTFHALARPPLRLTYEGTIYNAGVPPWYAPVPGGGGWLSDHNPPRAICAVGDALLLGGVGAEAGRSLAAVDLEGRKIWDGGHLETLRLAADGRYAYVVNNDAVIRLDPRQGFAQRKIFSFQYSDALPGHADDWIVSDSSGVTCHDGRMYIAYNNRPAPWIRSAVSAGAIDATQSFPPIAAEKTHDTAYTPAERIQGAFLAMPSSTSAYLGDAVPNGPMQHTLVLALTREVALGSVMLPSGDIQAYALKPGKQIPSASAASGPSLNRDDEADIDMGGLEDIAELGGGMDLAVWQPLARERGAGPGLAVLPVGTATRAILFKGPGLKRLDYGLLLDRRYRNAAPDAALVALEGATTQAGGWRTTRPADKPISINQPAVAALIWPAPTPVRGLAILRPMEWAGFDIDVWTGPTNVTVGTAELQANEHWRTVHRHRQNASDIKLRWHTYRVLHADFGDTLDVRAVRVRITVPPQSPDRSAPIDGGFEGLIAFQPIGGDPVLPPDLSQRITVLDLPDGEGAATLRQHVSVPQPTALAFDTNGVLHAALAAGIVRIRNVAEPRLMEVVIPRAQAKQPRHLLFDAAGLLYVLDGDSRQVIVFDPRDGSEVRRIGKPGGAQLGPWDPERLADPSAMTLDATGKLWVVDQFFQPRRTARFTRTGVHEKDLFGPTHYGGGGKMDAGDHAVINHLGMKFRIDYSNHTYRLEARLHPYSTAAFCPDRVTYWNGHRYLVGDGAVVTPFGDAGPIAGIYVEQDGVAVPLVQVGVLQDWPWMGSSPALRAAFGNLDLGATSFCWSDSNRDGSPQADEVQTLPHAVFRHCLGIGEDLSVNVFGHRLRPHGVRADGLPEFAVADLQPVPELTDAVQVNAQGESLVMGHKFLDAAGEVLWTYPDRYRGVQGSMKVPWGLLGRPPGELAGSGWWLGQLRVAGEELFCVNANQGDYFALTRDGLLAATILGGPRGSGKRFFSMPECVWGKTDLTDLRATVENFQGHVCQAADGRIYAIAGKQHITVIRVDGLERMQRQQGSFTVTEDDVRQVQAWAADRAGQESAMRRPRLATVSALPRPPTLDGQAGIDWPVEPDIPIRIITDERGKIREAHRARLGFDANNLYVLARSSNPAPVRNTGKEPARLFQSGDGFDLHVGLQAAADPQRDEPVAGDVRLVFTQVAGKPVVMLYRHRVTGPRLGGEPADFRSPVGETHIDEVVEVKTAQVVFAHDGKAWSLEAAIPWAAMGAKAPEHSVTLRGDIGILVADPNGIETVDRFYWANTALVIMSDLPAEARLHPQLWGELHFLVPDALDALDLPALPALDDAL